jgi:hypothetical protein
VLTALGAAPLSGGAQFVSVHGGLAFTSYYRAFQVDAGSHYNPYRSW